MDQFNEQVLRDLAAIINALSLPDKDWGLAQSIIEVERLLSHLVIEQAKHNARLPA